jgi:hypothetical protein
MLQEAKEVHQKNNRKSIVVLAVHDTQCGFLKIRSSISSSSSEKNVISAVSSTRTEEKQQAAIIVIILVISIFIIVTSTFYSSVLLCRKPRSLRSYHIIQLHLICFSAFQDV